MLSGGGRLTIRPRSILRGFAAHFVAILVLVSATGVGAKPFTTFESGQVRPLALSPDGTRLFAVNTPDGRLEMFNVEATGLVHGGSVPVGLEPVAVAARSNAEVWVVNHLSDSVSIVDVATTPARVTRTLLVGDEPRDIVFAGPRDLSGVFTRAFITTAHRGQNHRVGPQLTTPGVGRADVWVFDATELGSSLDGDELAILTLFGDTPRALAATPDGSTVYAAVFQSGNQTTTVPEGAVCDTTVPGAVEGSCDVFGITMPGGPPLPHANHAGIAGPETGLIVKFDRTTASWLDELGRNWNPAVRFNLPDLDVFAIDAMVTPPVATSSWASIGTVLFNMAVNPATGVVYVSNTEARNEVRFEGPGTLGTTVRGHLHEARITVLTDGGPSPRHLNKHIDYSALPQPPGVKERSLATPLGLAVSEDGRTLYVAAFGSGKVGVFQTQELEDNTFVPDAATHITVSGGGPSGVVLDETHGCLYVLTRFDNAVSVIDLGAGSVGVEVAHIPLPSPEPPVVVEGRPFLYEASFSSSNGEASCASCHVFGDFDSLAWDLGNPNGDPMPVDDGLLGLFPLHPLKGPMTTQSLRGLAQHGPMHWRGDRSGSEIVPPGQTVDERAAFESFNVAFAGLLGRDDGAIPITAMRAFAEFALQITYPPNPIRNLDNTLTPSQQRGRNIYFNVVTDQFTCNFCHRLSPRNGLFGTTGRLSQDGVPQLFKVPHLRNLYQKIGKFGIPTVSFFRNGDNEHMGSQVRGFGFLHDGSTDTVFRHARAVAFVGFPSDPADESLPGDAARRDIEAFLHAFDSDLAPVVGQQVTLSATNATNVNPRIDLLIERAGTPFDVVDHPGATECDLVVKGVLGTEARGWYRTPTGSFQSDRAWESPFTDGEIRAQAAVAGQERTYTCAPPGSAVRMGVDRDGDGLFDRDELDVGLDPTAADFVPGRGGPRTDCIAEWVVNNPRNDPLVDRRGLPNVHQTCTDGDALCDADRVADGQCTFQVGVCFNVRDRRLVQGDGQSSCTPSDVETWEINLPRPDSEDPVRAANATALRDSVLRLGNGAFAGATGGQVTFSPPERRNGICTDQVGISLPLQGTHRDRRSIAHIRIRTTTGVPFGQSQEGQDTDRLRLVCMPPAG